jgi:hypothetical protein
MPEYHGDLVSYTAQEWLDRMRGRTPPAETTEGGGPVPEPELDDMTVDQHLRRIQERT